tara:strand:- start:1938 stop:2426 length:489 start_codon:yes stop_codon:yes gene_type:complete
METFWGSSEFNLKFKWKHIEGRAMTNEHLISKLNQALGWELRAINMYAHYAAYIRGIHRLQLEPHFTSEANESMVHSNIVRSAIVKLGGVAVTERNQTPIEHVSSYLDMLAESLKTETKAAEVYGELIAMIEESGDAELHDAIEQIYLAEVRSVEELRRLAE